MGPGRHRRGVALVTAALPRGPTGPYQLQAAIAAVHDEAENPEATDWRQIAALYGVLLRLDDNPVVALNHAVAVSMVAGPRAGLELVQRLGADARINADRRFHAVRGHLLEMAGDRPPRWRRTGQPPGWPPTSSNSATSISRSRACATQSDP